METTLEYENVKHALIQLSLKDFSSTFIFEPYDGELFRTKLQEYLDNTFKFDTEVSEIEFNHITQGFSAIICLKESVIQYSYSRLEFVPELW